MFGLEPWGFGRYGLRGGGGGGSQGVRCVAFRVVMGLGFRV